MEQNNFEKKIQQKLDELKIPPSEAVWENVEKYIGKRKYRKRILIFFLLFVSLAVGGYYMLNSITNETNSQNELVTRINEKGSEQTKRDDSSFRQTGVLPENDAGKTKVSGETSANKKTHSQEIESNKVERRTTGGPDEVKDIIKTVASKNKNTKGIEPAGANKKILPGSKQTVPDSKRTNNQKNDLDIDSHEKVQEENTAIVANGVEHVPDENIEPQQEVTLQSGKIADTISADSNKYFSKKTDGASKKIPGNQQSRKWKFGVTFSGGTSTIGGGTAPGINNLSSSARLDFVSFPSPANNSTLSYFNNYFTPSPIKNSMAFIGGVYIEKNISRKNKIDLGISYKYYSLINTTGNKIDFNIAPSLSAESLYSSWSNTNTYRNNFHYIELPISIKFQLGNSKTLPIYWSAGVSISQLISSNSLQFKSVPGLYYNDNSLYNKTQVGLQTGFSALLFAKRKVPINIGPYFIYNMSKLADEGLYGGKHFSFIGIKADILLGKK